MENEITLYGHQPEKLPEKVSLSPEAAKSLADLNIILRSKNRISFRDNSVLKPSAQLTGLCVAGNLSALNKILIRVMASANTQVGIYEKAVIELQFLYGLRISEVLGIKWQDILFNGSINIKGLKGSESRLVYPVQYRDFWINFHNSKSTIGSSYNRFYFYRIFKKFGIYSIMVGNSKASVTHYLRYMFVQQLKNSGKTKEQIQQIIGHKSIKSTLHYISKLNEKN